jgi:AcrR family transcriptional regulator
MGTRNKLRPRTKAPEQRRDEIMNAAERLFLKDGVALTTIEQITSGAGVAKGTFYLYFSSKHDVLAALGDRFGQGLLRNIKAAIARQPEKDWEAKLAAWARACVTGYLDSIRLHDVVFYGSRPASRDAVVNNIVIDHLCGLLQAGVDAGAWSIDDCRSTAVFLFSGLHGVVDDAFIREKRPHRNRLIDQLEQLFFKTAICLKSR